MRHVGKWQCCNDVQPAANPCDKWDTQERVNRKGCQGGDNEASQKSAATISEEK
jgi:hypothetical protein